MSSSETTRTDITEAAMTFGAACAEAIERDRLDDVPDDVLGQVFGSVVRLYAAKIQAGSTARPVAGNSGVTITDVCIGCTALMDVVGLETFELGAWQSMSGLGQADGAQA